MGIGAARSPGRAADVGYDGSALVSLTVAEGEGFVHLRGLGRFGATSRVAEPSRRSSLGMVCDRRRMAEGEGFEPPVRFPVQRFSRPPP
jgi:hypothetical protein